jgi:SAM-dependent methyltransferase
MGLRTACTLASVTQRAPRLEREDGRRLFGLDPAAYAAGRPGYPAELFEILVGRCGLGPGTATLEIGPGGGQATGELLARGAAPLTLVEPDPRLADYLGTRFGDAVRVVDAAFEAASIDEGSFDLAVAATSWHWVEQGPGLRKVGRALRPGGWWAMWWSAYHDPEAEPDALFRELSPILDHLSGFDPSGRSGRADVFAFHRSARIDDIQATELFDQVGVERIEWALPLDPARARALFGTFSPVLALPVDERERVLDAIAAVIADRFDGLFERRCATILYTARRV